MPKVINFIKMSSCNKVLVTFQNDAFRLRYVVWRVCARPTERIPGHERWVLSPVSEAAALSCGRLTAGTLLMQMRLYECYGKRGRNLEKGEACGGLLLYS